jgi:CHAT domain-containing protein
MARSVTIFLLLLAAIQTQWLGYSSFSFLTSVLAQGSPLAHAVKDSPATVSLHPGVRLEGDLDPGELRSFRLVLARGDYIRLSIDKGDLALGVGALGPSGQSIAKLERHRSGPIELSMVADTTGPYLLEIHSLEDGEYVGHYRLQIDQLRESVDGDRASVLAERAMQDADRLRADWTADSLTRAIEKYLQARRLWRRNNDRRREALCILNVADTYLDLSENQKALHSYKTAANLSSLSKDLQSEIKALNGVSYVLIDLGEPASSFRYSNRARQLSEQIGDRAGFAEALDNAGLAHCSVGDKTKSLPFFAQAFSLFKALGDRLGQAQSLTNQGYAFADLGRPDDALESFQQALSLSFAAKNHKWQALALTAIGIVSVLLGNEQKALEFHYKAFEIFQALGNRYGEAVTLTGIGSANSAIGEDRKALNSFRRSWQTFRSIGKRDSEGVTLKLMGDTYFSFGDQRRALQYYNRGLALCRVIGNRHTEAYAVTGIGRVYESFGKSAKALIYYNRGLDLGRAVGNRRVQSQALNGIGHVYEKLGQREKALESYDQALALVRAVEDRNGETLVLHNVARVKRDLGDLGAAYAVAKSLIDLIESLRSRIAGHELRRSYSASVHDHYNLYIDLLMQMHNAKPSAGYAAAALQISERARARGLLDMLVEIRADIRRGIDTNLLEREHSLQRTINAQADRQIRLLNGKPSPDEIAALKEEIADLIARYEALESQIRTASPRYAMLTQPRTLTLADIQQQVMDQDTLLLEYSLGEPRSYLWAVTHDSMESFELPSRTAIQNAVGRLYDVLKTPTGSRRASDGRSQGHTLADADEEYFDAASTLSRMILRPVAGKLATKRLLIVADGPLQYIPFACLIDPRSKVGDARFDPLVSTHEIVNLPSTSALAEFRKETVGRTLAPKTVAVFADPVFNPYDSRVTSVSSKEFGAQRRGPTGGSQPSGFPNEIEESDQRAHFQRLRFARQEAEQITSLVPEGQFKLFSDFEANRTVAMSDEISRYRIIHFATHAALNNSHPELSGVVLSLVDRGGNAVDGFLRLNEIYNMRLSADLVVLSACDTALGKPFAGEGLVGLTRGFMYAGVPKIVATLWEVDDAAAEALMALFYKGMLGPDHLTPAEALRAAQVAMRKQKHWQFPYYWAGFILEGDWK